MLKNKLKNFTLVMGATILVPLTPADWNQLKYSSIPSNDLSFTESKQMVIEVKESASPIFHKLAKPIKVKSLKVSGEIKGRLNLENKIQGNKGADDFAVRIGLVLKGNKKLNFAQKIIAAKWIKDLYALAGNSSGIDHIEFINVSAQDLKWEKRVHPLSDLLKEEIVGKVESGLFEIQKKFDSPVEVIAIWLSSDGDDTKSIYTVRLDKIELVE